MEFEDLFEARCGFGMVDIWTTRISQSNLL